VAVWKKRFVCELGPRSVGDCVDGLQTDGCYRFANPLSCLHQTINSKKDKTMERILLPIVIFGGVIALVGGIIWLLIHAAKKRREALMALATEMGLQFSEVQDEDLLLKMQAFSLFNKGHGRKMKNVMTTETDDARLSIFDYQYTTGGGQHSHTHQQTVVALESDTLELPVFSLRPEGFFQKIGAAIGMQDIDFETHPDFSDSFVLTGNDEQAVRSFFDETILDLFVHHKGICVESTPGTFIYFRNGQRKPEQIREFMNQAYGIYSAFEDRLSRSGATTV